MSTQSTAPLTEAELSELDDFLLSSSCDEESLSIDEAHGYLTALQLPPLQADTAQWQRTVWGEPQFADPQQERRIQELLLRLYAEITETLQRRRDFEPLVIEIEEDGETLESYEGWCYGFMLGVDQHEAPWDALPKSEQALLVPMAQLSLLGGEEEEDMSEDEYTQWVELIPGAVMGLYAYWHHS